MVAQSILVLLVEQFLHTIFLHQVERRLTQVIHEEENGLFPVPEMLAYESLDPELQHSHRTYFIRLSAYTYVCLGSSSSGDVKG